MNKPEGLYQVPLPLDACYRCRGEKRLAYPGLLTVLYETCSLCKGTGKIPRANQMQAQYSADSASQEQK